MTQRKKDPVPGSGQPMVTRYEFKLELKISDPAEIATEELQDRVLDAIQDYDARGRLLTGPQMPGGISCLVSLSLPLVSQDREPDRSARPVDGRVLQEKYPFWEASQAEYEKVVGISVAIDDEIERLREVQAELWRRNDSASHAPDRRAFTAELKRLRRLLSRLRPTFSKTRKKKS